jgi:hypothetical protein
LLSLYPHFRFTGIAIPGLKQFLTVSTGSRHPGFALWFSPWRAYRFPLLLALALDP